MKPNALRSAPEPTGLPQCPDSSLHIGRVIRRLREINGSSQIEISLGSTAHLSYISTMERCHNNISIKKVEQICNALGIKPGLLFDIHSRIEQASRFRIVSDSPAQGRQ